MTSQFDALQKLIMADMRRDYTETTIDHSMNPRNLGYMENADGFGKVTGPCGDTMEIWLRVKKDIITNVSFFTDGCGATIAAASMVTEMVRGKTILEAQKTGQQDVLNALGGLPEGHLHCALLAANTLKEAIKDYLTFKRKPWKKAYRKY